MVLCIIALFVSLFLSLFSVRYREIAKEALDCSLKMVTLRKCEGSVENKLRAAVFSSLAKYNKGIAAFVFKNFSLLSIVFTVVLIVSSAYALYSLMNFILYGTCDPTEGNCVIVDLLNKQSTCDNITNLS